MIMTMTMMKNPVTLATCLLLLSSLAVLVKESSGSYSPGECCFDFYFKPLLSVRVASFKPTDPACAKEGVVFTMKRGRKLCVDPTQEWVKKIMQAKEKPVNTTLSE
ncbi:C-C motif chemokine 3-like [Kryptolebias marmoratus]|uniref:C-C motif chemokine n=1 Tax=Kryptolebias marmoratus TaxID=37003 RepID=A0A3Q3B7K8_KRYMA|nr:C-C motif chemokine 3-like [Kryptolebias marmoratus]